MQIGFFIWSDGNSLRLGLSIIFWIIVKIPEWSAMSVIMIPDLYERDISFVYMWSIKVAECGVIRVGFVINGIYALEKILSIYEFVLLCISNFNRSILKSPIITTFLFSCYMVCIFTRLIYSYFINCPVAPVNICGEVPKLYTLWIIWFSRKDTYMYMHIHTVLAIVNRWHDRQIQLIPCRAHINNHKHVWRCAYVFSTRQSIIAWLDTYHTQTQ